MVTAVLDAGKSFSKLSLWSADGSLLARRTRPNAVIEAAPHRALDAAGIDHWLAESLRELAREHAIGAFIPVGHGAAAAIVRDGALACAPLDYEHPIPDAERAQYAALRDRFADTGSPLLPAGLNLGLQLFHLEGAQPDLFAGDALILPWPQYWSWRLSGVAASEVTSLGCHSDLWRPSEARPSKLADARGWSRHLPPLRRAGDLLGRITPEWVQRCGLSPELRVHCGIHDSNAALLAARSFAGIGGHDATVLSTGTWFIAMRSAAVSDARSALDEARDCLVNVDAEGRPVPSARFMGGREIEQLIGAGETVDGDDQPALLEGAAQAIRAGAMALPAFAPGCGPYPQARGRWLAEPAAPVQRRAAACLYAALVADASLSLIGARGSVLVEGRFARAQVFTRALAALRPDLRVLTCTSDIDVSFGALRLLHPELTAQAPLAQVPPLDADLSAYRRAWHAQLSS